MRMITLILCIILIIGLFSGCSDSREVNDLLYTIAIGFDKGKEKKYSISLQYAIPILIGGGSEKGGGSVGGSGSEEKKGAQKMVGYITLDAQDLYTATSYAETFLSKHVNLAQTKLVVLSKEIASEDISELTASLSANSDFRPSVHLAVAKDKALDYLKSITTELETNPSEYYEKAFYNGSQYITSSSFNKVIYKSITHFSDIALPLVAKSKEEGSQGGEQVKQQGGEQKKSQGGGQGSEQGKKQGNGQGGQDEQGKQEFDIEKELSPDQKLIYPGMETNSQPEAKEKESSFNKQPVSSDKARSSKGLVAGETNFKGDNKSDIMGCAVFKNNKMVGELNGREAEIFNLLNGSFNNRFFEINRPFDAEKIMPIFLTESTKPQVEINTKKENPEININLNLQADSYEQLFSITSPDKLDIAQEYIQNVIKTESIELLNKLSRQYKADILGFNGMLKSKFSTQKAWKSYGFDKKYPNTTFNVNVSVTLKRATISIFE